MDGKVQFESLQEFYFLTQNQNKVQHRFKSFVNLHDKLQSSIAIAKDLLPGKKIIKNSKFLEQRRVDLEKYLQTVTSIVQQLPVIPLELVQFLEFHRYDVLCLLQNMALALSWRPEEKSGKFTILEVSFDFEASNVPTTKQPASSIAPFNFRKASAAMPAIPTSRLFIRFLSYTRLLLAT